MNRFTSYGCGMVADNNSPFHFRAIAFNPSPDETIIIAMVSVDVVPGACVFFFSKSNPILSIVPNYLVALNGKTRVRVFQNLFYEQRRVFEMDGRMKAKKKRKLGS